MTVVSVQHKATAHWRSYDLSDIVWITSKAAFDKFSQLKAFATFFQQTLDADFKPGAPVNGPEYYWRRWLLHLNISLAFLPVSWPVKLFSPSHVTMLPNYYPEPYYNFSTVVDVLPFDY
jgi:hypothetical protein